MFNQLHEDRPALAEQVRASDKDPFYCAGVNDPKWDAFVQFIETNWYRDQAEPEKMDEDTASTSSSANEQTALGEAYTSPDGKKWVTLKGKR